MTITKKRVRGFLITLFIFVGLISIMDSCLQFRMSKSEIGQYFQNKKYKGSIHQYETETQRIINYLKVGDTGKPLVGFVHGSPGSLSAFIDFMADTILLKEAQ